MYLIGPAPANITIPSCPPLLLLFISRQHAEGDAAGVMAGSEIRIYSGTGKIPHFPQSV
ncbi:MAG: hypothetical protein IID44_11310 [Planctomycetes bacterium]|nr:hypothetical protein [Planctomycetota bacterium]